MRIALLILQLLPYALAAVKAVEESLPKASGDTKKQVVMSTVSAATQMGAVVPDEHAKALSAAIDNIVQVLNASGVFGHSNTTPPVLLGKV